MRLWYCIYGLLIFGFCGGCLSRQPFTTEQMNQYWTLSCQPQVPVKESDIREKGFPTYWKIRQQKSLIRSTVSIVRAMDTIKAGTDDVDFSLSPAHAATLADILSEARLTLEQVRELAESSQSGGQDEWTRSMSEILVKMEKIIRQVDVGEPEREDDASEEPMGLAAEPLLEMLSSYLNDQTEGGLLQDLGVSEINQLRSVLSQIVLKLGFAIAGKQLPDDLRGTVTQTMSGMERMEDLEDSLASLLTGIIVFQDIRERELKREAFSVQSIRKKKELSFSYAMPDRRYTY